jgi:hypothetical protein
MAFLFADSFEGYDDSGDMVDRDWDISSTPAIDTSIFYDNTRSLRMDANDQAQYNLGNGNGPETSFLSFWFRYNHATTSVSRVVDFQQNGINANVGVRLTTNDRLQFYNALSSPIGDASSTLETDRWYHVEIKMVFKSSIDLGDVELYLDGELVIQLAATTDTNWFGSATIDGFNLRTTTTTSENHWFDSVIWWSTVAGDTWTDLKGRLRIETLYPNGNGNDSGFDGSDGNSTDNYLLVDDPAGQHDGNTTYIESETVTDIDLFTYTNLTRTDISSIEGVNSILVAQRTQFSPQRGATQKARVSGTTYTADDAHNPLAEVVYEQWQYMWDEDPNASAAWTESTVNGAEFGVEVTS